MDLTEFIEQLEERATKLKGKQFPDAAQGLVSIALNLAEDTLPKARDAVAEITNGLNELDEALKRLENM